MIQQISQKTIVLTQSQFNFRKRTGTLIEGAEYEIIGEPQPLINSLNKLNADLVDASTSTQKFVTSSQITNFTNAYNYIIKTGSADPTTSTAGKLGQFYLKTTTSKIYICTKATSPYTWVEVSPSIIDDSSTASTTATWSANKLNTMIGNVETLLEDLL